MRAHPILCRSLLRRPGDWVQSVLTQRTVNGTDLDGFATIPISAQTTKAMAPGDAIVRPRQHLPRRFLGPNEPTKGDVPQTPFASRAGFEIFSLI
jgi:hypothetical protein